MGNQQLSIDSKKRTKLKLNVNFNSKTLADCNRNTLVSKSGSDFSLINCTQTSLNLKS